MTTFPASVFEPTDTPLSVLKTLVKRLRKHPASASLTNSEALDVVARTFNHASWHHAVSQPQKVDLMAPLADKAWRNRFYTHLEHCLEAGVSLYDGLAGIAQAAGWAGDRILEGFCEQLNQHYLENGDVGLVRHLEELILPHSRLEAIVLRTGFLSEPALSLRTARGVQP